MSNEHNLSMGSSDDETSSIASEASSVTGSTFKPSYHEMSNVGKIEEFIKETNNEISYLQEKIKSLRIRKKELNILVKELKKVETKKKKKDPEAPKKALNAYMGSNKK